MLSVFRTYSSHPNIVNWNGRLGDFADTAHVVRQLDLVISVDTGGCPFGCRSWYSNLVVASLRR